MYHSELSSVLSDDLEGRDGGMGGPRGKDICICIADLPC